MASTNDRCSATAPEERATLAAPADRATDSDSCAAAIPGPLSRTTPPSSEMAPPSRSARKWLGLAIVAIGLGVAGYTQAPTVTRLLNTVSTDDAYVNGHVTFVAPRVQGQVKRVLVDDNYRVKKGAVLVELDKEPYQVQLAIKKAAVEVAEADLAAAQAQVRSLVAQSRANRFKLKHAMEEVNNQVATLHGSVQNWKSKKASLELAKANLRRGEELAPNGISKEDLDQRRQTVKVDEAAVEQALQQVYAIRVGLGLPAQPAKGQELSAVPADLDENFSSVRQALGDLVQSAAQFGFFPMSWNATPRQAVDEFDMQDPQGNLDRIVARIIPQAPGIKQAEAKLLQARDDLNQAALNLRYCDIVSLIDGVVTRRNVNPGNYIQVGQSLMAIRSVTEIWIDANFKETQLADLRIGQRVSIEADIYGSRREYEGRITGFTMGTGQTLALLPPQNATGNFVKIVQRLPVRIELTDYDPEQAPLFVGLSVVPYVYYKEAPTGSNAGKYLQPPVLQTDAMPEP